MKNSLWIIHVFLFSCMLNINAQDWTQYLGPGRNGTSPEKGILHNWLAGGKLLIRDQTRIMCIRVAR